MNKNIDRDIDKYFLDIVKIVGSRGTCDRGRSGCIIVKDKQIIATGYVGSPSGMPHCDEIGHWIEDGHCIRTTHAEQNAIVNAAKRGVSINESTLYCTMCPCFVCAKLIVNAGIKKVVADYDYHDSQKSRELFYKAKIELIIINNKIMSYEKEKPKAITGGVINGAPSHKKFDTTKTSRRKSLQDFKA